MSTNQVQVNTFTDGLNTDLHPLTVPNTILTDCINGTIITYNGNEYILQNDMGNYQLSKAQLPPDFIPIGVKEYGNIIYIVSYNPIDKKSQIGSYPSPKVLFDSANKSSNKQYHGIQINTLSDKWEWNDTEDGILNDPLDRENVTTDVLFTQYSSKQILTVLFPDNEKDIKDTFLSPGDKYWLYLDNNDNEQSTWKFQKQDYYSLTESKEVYKINEEVKTQNTEIINDDLMPYVSWSTPGWLGYKPTLLNIDFFNIYLTEITLPSFYTTKSETKVNNNDTNKSPNSGKLSFNIQGQITINKDPAWKNELSKLKVFFEYKSNKYGSTWKSIGDNRSSCNEEDIIDYGNKIDVLTYNASIEDILIDVNDKVINIRATPYIIDEENNIGIVYDNFKVSYQINLYDLYNLNKIKVFDTYKYLVDDNGITINFSILSPTVNTKNITCKYTLYEFKDLTNWNNLNKLSVTPVNGHIQKDIESLNLFGQNMITINFDDQYFKKGNIYIFSLDFFEKNKKVNISSNEYDKIIEGSNQSVILITSELLNSFYKNTDQFQSILKSEWLSKLQNILVAPQIITEPGDPNMSTEYIKTIFLNELLNYNDSMSLGIYDSNNIEESRMNAINTLMSFPITSSIYSGVASIDKQTLNIPINSLIAYKNEELWDDMTDEVQILDPKYTSGLELYTFDSQTNIIVNSKSSYIYNNITIPKIHAYLDYLIANSYKGKDGERIYLNERIMQCFGTMPWGNFYPGMTNTSNDWNINLLRGELGNKYRGKSVYGYAFLKDWGRSSGGEKHRLTINMAAREDRLFKLDNEGDLLIPIDLQDDVFYRQYDGNDSVVIDSFFNDRRLSMMPFLIPIYLGNYRINSGSLNKPGLFFPSGSYPTGATTFPATGFAFPVMENNKVLPAAVRFFTTDGYIQAWDDSIKRSDYFYNIMYAKGENNQYYDTSGTQIVGALLLAIGIHIYTYRNLHDVDQLKLLSSGQVNEIRSANSGKISLTRNDTITKINYRNADLLNTNISDGCIIEVNNKELNADENVILNVKDFSNLIGTINNLTKISNLSSNYTNPHELEVNTEEFTNYQFALSTELNTALNKYLALNNFENNKVYSDWEDIKTINTPNRDKLGNILDAFRNNMLYQDNNFYWSAKVNKGIGARVDGENKSGVLRAIDLSDLFQSYATVGKDIIIPLTNNVSEEFKTIYGNKSNS